MFDNQDVLQHSSELESKQESSNPNYADVDSETREKLKGDAIGDTLYSESFVVKTLMKLNNDIEWSETLEEELCFLWDTTMEKDMCNFLIELSYPNIACNIIKTCKEERLIEILIGILANICSVCNNSNVVSQEDVASVIAMLTSDDPLILIQVARFFKATSYNTEKVLYITNDVLEQINFILMNTTNNDLITNMLDAISKFTVYNKIDVALLKGNLVKSSCIAYQTLCRSNEKQLDLHTFVHLLQIISNICTYINESSSETIVELLNSVNNNINVFLLELERIFNFYNRPENLLPLEEELLYIVDALVSVFQILKINNSKIFVKVTAIISILLKNKLEDIDVFFELFCYFVFVSSFSKLVQDLNQLPKKNVLSVLMKIKNQNADYQFEYKANFNRLCDKYIQD